MQEIRIGIIGGSGLYRMDGVEQAESIALDTPFGAPSDELVCAVLRGKRVVFLPRHGRGHRLSPTHVPYRANIHAFKQLGVRFILSANACGSLREDYAPGHLVIPDQIIDYTQARDRSFFTGSYVAHIGVAEPFSPELSRILHSAAQQSGATVHAGGIFLIEEGPRFATRAESQLFRSWSCSLIGMTSAPEAFLAREAEIAYATIAHVTDYDVWHERETPVNVEDVLKVAAANVERVQATLATAVEMLDETSDFAAHAALAQSLLGPPEQLPTEEADRLRLLLAKYYRL
ncbi:MAG: S-methyl-5'-thioadenosine phosphorylase [Anaerolineaceae bacterium]|nr:S-methyl-5'-thioadenosine phosphorylase [Chloroflexota bacterium]MCY4010075.1 S-methyl-5'-thioadenosine phosphorylase [Anaerolineaceae bacterium]